MIKQLVTNRLHEAEFFSSSQGSSTAHKNPHFWETKILMLRSQEPTTVPNLTGINPAHALPYYFLKIHFYITLLFTSWFTKLTASFIFPNKKTALRFPLHHTCHMTCPFGPTLCDAKITFCTDHKAPLYAVFSSPLLSHPS